MRKNIINIISLSLVISGCSTLGFDKKKENEVVIVSSSEEKKEYIDSEKMVVTEDTATSHKKCLISVAPETVFGVGVASAVAAPVVYIVSALYLGGEYYLCYQERREKPEIRVDLEPAIAEARQKVADELRATFEDVKNRLENKAISTEKQVNSAEERIRKVSEEEEARIERMGGRVLKELYEQIEAIQNSEIEVIEKEEKQYVPLRSPE